MKINFNLKDGVEKIEVGDIVGLHGDLYIVILNRTNNEYPFALLGINDNAIDVAYMSLKDLSRKYKLVAKGYEYTLIRG